MKRWLVIYVGYSLFIIPAVILIENFKTFIGVVLLVSADKVFDTLEKMYSKDKP